MENAIKPTISSIDLTTEEADWVQVEVTMYTLATFPLALLHSYRGKRKIFISFLVRVESAYDYASMPVILL